MCDNPTTPPEGKSLEQAAINKNAPYLYHGSAFEEEAEVRMPMANVEIQQAVRIILRAIGEDPSREGLKNTPDRVARFWSEFINFDSGNIEVTFETLHTDQMVIVKDIDGWSLCEHHLLPWSFTAHVGYITGDRVVGLSKIPRIVQKHAHRLQLQERFTADIADELMKVADARGVGVVVTGIHTCATMRGIRTPRASMVTSAMRGIMLVNPFAKEEFLRLIG
jgi:GTP cyclohydrolase I